MKVSGTAIAATILLATTTPTTLVGSTNSCDASLPQSLNGTCNTLTGDANMGAAGMPFTFACDQHYPSGSGLYYFDKKARGADDPNTYAMDPPDAFSTLCSPDTCPEVGISHYYPGMGSNLLGGNPRKLSTALHSTKGPVKKKKHKGKNLFITFFGQFLIHDVFGELERTGIQASKGGYPDMNDPQNPYVLSGIPLDENDFFVNNVPGLNQVAYPTIGVSGPNVEVINDADGNFQGMEFYNARTDLVDLDGIYGLGGEVSSCIRSYEGGELKLEDYEFNVEMGPHNATVYLEDLPPPTTSCLSEELREANRGEIHASTENVTPLYGDFRNTENVAMGTVHLAFVRYHNYLARTHCASHGENDEDRFQCARQMNIAIYQHIVYGEYMEALTGRDLLSDYVGYKPGTDFTLMAEADICARFHFAVPNALPLKDANCQLECDYDAHPIENLEVLGDPPCGHIPLAGVRFDMFPFGAFTSILGAPSYFTNKDPYHQLLQGMSCTNVPKFNHKVDNIIRQLPTGFGGFDIPAFTYKRIEQLGIATYYQVMEEFVPKKRVYGRRHCPLSLKDDPDLEDPVWCFNYVTGNRKRANRLREGLRTAGMMPKVTNIPLWTGIAYEKKKRRSLLGRVQDQVIRDQLRVARDGDRFFYLHHMSDADIEKVSNVKLSHVLKEAFGDDLSIPDDVFNTKRRRPTSTAAYSVGK